MMLYALLLVFLVLARSLVVGDKFCGVDLEDAQNSVRLLMSHVYDVGLDNIYAMELINVSPSVGNHVALIATAAHRPSIASRRNRLAAAPI